MIFALSHVSSLNFEMFVLVKNVFPAVAQCGKNVLHPIESLVLCCITNLFEVNFLYTAEVFHSLCRTQSYNFVFKPFTFNVKEFKPAILLCCCFFSLLIFCSYVFSLRVTSLYLYFFKDIF